MSDSEKKPARPVTKRQLVDALAPLSATLGSLSSLIAAHDARLTELEEWSPMQIAAAALLSLLALDRGVTLLSPRPTGGSLFQQPPTGGFLPTS